MIQVLRNIFVRLWLTVLVAVPLCFYVMPGIRQIFPGMGPVPFSLGVVTICYVIIGFLLHFLGKKRIQSLIREAQMWERAAIFNKAGKKYLQAVRVYDSFLLSPVFAGKIKTRLTGALARFSLTCNRENTVFRQAVLGYLTTNPWDEALALLWLKRLCTDDAITDREQDLLTRLADIHHASPLVMPLLTKIFLDLGRRDFTAEQVYDRALAEPSLQKMYGQDIQFLLEEPEPEPELNEPAAFPVQKRQQRPGFPIDPEKLQDLWLHLYTGIRGLIQHIRTGVIFCLGVVIRYSGRVLSRIQVKYRWRFYLKAGILGGMSLWMVVFMYNTIAHLRAPKSVDEIEVIIEKKIPGSFTIQVAAYLKESHADKYLKFLRQQNVDARIKKTVGGGKTWYLVQVSEFADKAEAAAYGKQLKHKNIIEDFFVSNK